MILGRQAAGRYWTLVSWCGGPDVLPEGGQALEVGAGARGQAAVRGQADRVARVDRQREGQSEARATELLTLFYAVDGTAPPVEVSDAERAPGARAELARDVRLQRIERVLLARVAIEEFVVAGEPGHARRQLHG